MNGVKILILCLLLLLAVYFVYTYVGKPDASVEPISIHRNISTNIPTNIPTVKPKKVRFSKIRRERIFDKQTREILGDFIGKL